MEAILRPEPPVQSRAAFRSASRQLKKPLRVLLLEDSESDAELICRELGRSGLPTTTQRVDSETAFESALRSFAPDVVISDHSLGQFNAQSALELLRKVRPATPLIIVSGSLNGEKTVACLRAGAEDVIVMESLHRLGASISHAVHLRRPLDKLTPRQIEVLQMVAEGYRTREIAAHLQLSVKTIESHRGEIMKRLEIHEVVGLVRYAMRVGLVAIAA
jgi:DNA-binding NarL/FixJ family response regulator